MGAASCGSGVCGSGVLWERRPAAMITRQDPTERHLVGAASRRDDEKAGTPQERRLRVCCLDHDFFVVAE